MRTRSTSGPSGAADTRSSASRPSTARTAVAAAAAVVGALLVYNVAVDFVDTVLNGAFIDWVSSQFLNTHSLNEFGVSAELALDTAGTKYFFFQLGLLVVALVAASAIVSGRVCARRRERETVDRVAALTAAFMEHDVPADVVFPPGYERIALQMTRVRQEADARERALTAEAARKNDLVTYLAHDLKTPLTSVIGYLSLLDEVPDMPAAQRCRYVGVALSKAERLEALISEFFDITRYNLQGIELECAPVDLAFLLVQVADEFYPLLCAHQNTVEVVVEGSFRTAEALGEPLEVVADAARLARVMGNLVKNAISYSREGTAVRVAAERAGDTVRLTVADDGATIPSHKLRAIFDKFYRLDEARASSTGGAGLGLAIAREIVELHGGTIGAQSEAGRTVFTVELPAGGPGGAAASGPGEQDAGER